MSRRHGVALAPGFAIAVAMGAGACRERPKGPLESVRDALVAGDVSGATARVTGGACEADPEGAAGDACLRSVAARLEAPDAVASAHDAMASSSVAASAPGETTCAAAGLWLLRAHHAERLLGSDAWLSAIAGGVGPGADTLRLAVARAMDAEAWRLRRRLKDDPARRDLLAAVARSVPGACLVYARGEATTDDACVAHDLSRTNTPPRRETPLAHSARGAIALWIAATRALDLGQDRMTGEARVALGKLLASVRVTTVELEDREAEALTPGRTETEADAGSARAPRTNVPDASAEP